MPTTSDFSGLDNLINRLQRKLESPELIERLGADLAESLSSEAPRDTGATAKALSHVGTPQRTESGWSIGVGDKTKTGDINDPAPSGTLRAFYAYLESQGVHVRYTDWHGLSPDHKALLASERRAGKFGGRGPDYANYMWVQNFGNAMAKVRGTHFLESGIEQWRDKVPMTIKDYFNT